MQYTKYRRIDMTFKRLQEQAYDHLKQMVLADKFERETFYSETRIAEELGISRTPIRDALQRLSHDGLIDIMPSKGFRIHKLTYDDIIDIYQIRCSIEGYCSRLMTLHRKQPGAQEALAKLEELVEKQGRLLEEGNPVSELVELDYTFHLDIIAYSGNSVFSQIYSNQMYRMRMITVEGQERESRRASSLAEHRELVNAMRKESVDTVYECILHHYQNMLETSRMETNLHSDSFAAHKPASDRPSPLVSRA